MNSVLAYGDSLTWGFVPGTGERHALGDRWPQVMARQINSEIELAVDGLSGRTTAYDDHTAGNIRNGLKTLTTALSAHGPLNLIILMLGINDLQPHIAGTALAATKGMQRLVQTVQSFRPDDRASQAATPKVLIISPPHLCETLDVEYEEYFAGRLEESRRLGPKFQMLADSLGCNFFDAATVCSASPIDGVHLSAEETIKLGEGLAPVVQEILES